MSDADRRAAPRPPIALVVEYPGVEELLADYRESLSSGSTFVATDRDLAVGDPVRLTLTFPGLVRPLRLEGVVRATRTGERTGVDVEVVDYEKRVRRDLATVIEGLRRRSPELVRKKSIRLLVVEDNPHVARLIADGLTGGARFRDEVGFEFVAAHDGRQALAALDGGGRFDAAIIDMYLPVLDGEALIARIRADLSRCSLPILAVSAGGPAARSSALAAGADLFLDKPMRLRAVVDAIAALVGLAVRER